MLDERLRSLTPTNGPSDASFQLNALDSSFRCRPGPHRVMSRAANFDHPGYENLHRFSGPPRLKIISDAAPLRSRVAKSGWYGAAPQAGS